MNSAKYGLVLLVVALLGATVYLMFGGQQETQTPPPGGVIVQPDGQNQAMRTPVYVPLAAQNGSGQEGKVELSEVDGKTVVTINVQPGPAGVAQPAHIHAGSCAGGLGEVKYNLNPVIDGKSTTTLAPVLHFIHGLGTTAINIHKSTSEQSVYAACGDLTPAFDAAMVTPS